MSYIKEYVLLLVVIIFYTDVCWSIGVPKIKSLKQQQAKRNRYHRVLKCVVGGSPVPSISWRFNGQIIEENEHYELKKDNSELIIKEVTTNDTGHYRCYAANTYGMIFAQFHLKIVGVGEFEDGYTKDDITRMHNVTIGKPVHIKCPPHTDLPGQIYGWGIPPLEIFSPGKPIERVFLSDYHGGLYFSYITDDDIDLINAKGGIRCLLYEDFTNLVSSVKITLQSDGKESTEDIAPQMVMLFANDTIAIKGGEKVLRCGATGRPHPIFKWYKDGKVISTDDGKKSLIKGIYIGAKGLVLRIPTVKAEDAGLYKCAATNSEGTDSKAANLIVHSKVTWTQELLETYNIPVKTKITLKCGAQGVPQPKFIWYHNNTIIGSSNRRTVKDGTMEIAVSDFGDCGMYLCTAENYLNTVVSPAYVTIEDVPPVFLKKITGVHYYLQGNHYSLNCDATGGPEPSITWYKDGTLVTNSKHLTVTADGRTLLFKDVTKVQNGGYKCVAENRKAKIESSAVVKVFIKTTITKSPDKVRYKAGNTAYLFCDATFDTTLKDTWHWLKDGKLIEYNNRVYLKDNDRVDKRLTTHTLKVKDLEAGDAGEYTCKVFTVADATFRLEDTATGSITVITAPLPVGNLKLTGSFDKDKKKSGDGSGKKTDPKKPGDGSGDKKTDPSKTGDGSGDKKTDPSKDGTSDDGEPTLTWDKPNKYVGPAEKYIIEYAKANSSDWTQYDPPKQYEDTSVKLEKDKLPAATDVVFRIRAIATDPQTGKEMVGEPSNATEAGKLVTPTRAPKVQPSNLRLEMDEGENATISWDKLDEVDRPGPGFKVVGAFRETKPNKDKEFTNFTKDGDSNSVEGPVASDDGVDREYEVFIATKNDAGQGPFIRKILKVPGKKPSQKVGDVTLVNVTAKGASIKWDEVSGATGYRIYYTRKETRKRRNTQQAELDVTDTTATLTDLKPGSQYEITVAALNMKGAGPRSDPLPVETKNGVPGAPTDVDLDTYADTVKLGWQPPKEPGVKNYTITWYPKDDPTKKKTMTVPADDREAFITDKGMDPQTYYTVEVAANSDEGTGDPWVMEGVVIGEPDVPGKPAQPYVEAINDTKVNVSFRLPPDYNGGLPKNYNVCYSDGTGKDKCINAKYPDKPYIVVDNLDHKVTYDFYTVAKNDKGVGEKSNKISIKPLDPPTTPAPPTTTTIAPITNATTPALVVIAGSTGDRERAFYEETWFIILLIILLILIIIAIILCIICNRRGGRYPVGKKEKDYGGWDKDPLKDYSDNAMENGGADLPLISPTRSPGQDSLKKAPFDDDEDDDSLADYGEGYGDMGQYGTDTKKEKNGQTVC